MGVDVVRGAVGGPSGVPDAEAGRAAAAPRRAASRGCRACRPSWRRAARRRRRSPRRRSRSRGTPAGAGPRPRRLLRPAARRTRRFHTWPRAYRSCAGLTGAAVRIAGPDRSAECFRWQAGFARIGQLRTPARDSGVADRAAGLGPYVERSRADWAELAEHAQISLDAATLERVRGLGDPTSMLDVREVYLPLTRLLSRYFLHTGELHRSTNDVPAARGAAGHRS